MRFFTLFLVITLCFQPVLQAQDLAKDRKSERYFDEGQAYFNNENYLLAAREFDEIGDRKFNRLTTPSLLLAGIAYLKANDIVNAEMRFNELLSSYPASIYRDDAMYHRGLVLLRDVQHRIEGLDVLLDVYENTNDPDLRQYAEDRIKSFLYNEADLYFLRHYYRRVRSNYRLPVLEALCYKLDKSGKREEALRFVKAFKAAGGEGSNKLDKLLGATFKEPARKQSLKIAVLVPMMVPNIPVDPDETMKLKRPTKLGLEFVNGMKLALESRTFPGFDAIDVRLFNTKKSDDITSELIANELPSYEPDLILGPIFNGPSKLIVEYANRVGVPHFVPFSPKFSLVDNTEQSFLATSGIQTQMQYLAKFVTDTIHARSVTVVTDGSSVAKYLSSAFKTALKQGKQPITIRDAFLPDVYKVDDFHARLKSSPTDVVYMPMVKPDVANYFLTKMFTDSIGTQIIGLQDWPKFSRLETELMSNFKVMWPAAQQEGNDSTKFERFYKDYLRVYDAFPSQAAMRGYDLVTFVLDNYGQYAKPITIAEAIRKASRWRGILQDYHYDEHQDNQAMQMLQMIDNRVVNWKEIVKR